MTKTRKLRTPNVEAAEPSVRDPTAHEVRAIVDARRAYEARPTRAKVKLQGTEGSTLKLSNAHNDTDGWAIHLADMIGTSSRAFTDETIRQLANAVSNGRTTVTEVELNSALALMGAVAPKDELEAAIGVQIVASHFASLDFLSRARSNAGEYRETAEAYAGMATKVSRTMAAHVETLTKLRSGGKQTHEVRYVYVNGPAVFGDGTQAVFGGVGTQGGGGFCGKAGQPHAVASLADAAGLQMWGEDPQRQALPIARGVGSEAMPDAWRRARIRSPDRQGERALSDGPAHAGATRGARTGPRRAGVGQG